VKEKWSDLSEQMMYEWTMATPTAYNRAKRGHYAFWMSVKNEPVAFMSFEEVLRLCKIRETHAAECKRPAFRRR
jgi:hypothetical protein